LSLWSVVVHLLPHFSFRAALYIIEVGEEGVRWVLASQREARNHNGGKRIIGHGRRELKKSFKI